MEPTLNKNIVDFSRSHYDRDEMTRHIRILILTLGLIAGASAGSWILRLMF